MAYHSETQDDASALESKAYYAEQGYLENGETFFDDEGNAPEQFAGFIGIETFCCNCDKFFPSKLQLHKHLRKRCTAKKSPQLFNQELLGNLNEPKLLSAAVGIPQVVESSASISDLGTGFGFRG